MMDQHRSGPSCYHLEVKNTHHCKKMQCQEAPLHQLASSGLPEGLHLRAHQRAASNGTSHPAMHKQQADGEEKTRSTHSGVGTLMKSWQGAAQFAGRQDMCSQGCHSSAPQVPNRCRNLLNIFTSSWKPPSLRKSGLPVSAPTSIALVATKTISWVSMLVHDSPRLELAIVDRQQLAGLVGCQSRVATASSAASYSREIAESSLCMGLRSSLHL